MQRRTQSLRVIKAARGDSCALPEGVERPRTRGDCVDGPRPCPWYGCRYHLALDVTSKGAIKMDTGPLQRMEHTCALDAAEDGARSLEEIGKLLGIGRERVRQIEAVALEQMRDHNWTSHR